MVSETRKQKIKRLYEVNQNGLDKALLSVVLALPSILIFLYDKFDKTDVQICHLYLWAVACSFVMVVLFLFGFIFAKRGCNLDDFANSTKCKHKKFDQMFANFYFKLSDYCEKIYILDIIVILVLLFFLFYFSLYPEEASLNSQQTTTCNYASMDTKTSINPNDIRKEKIMSENNKPTMAQDSMTPMKSERANANNNMKTIKSENTSVTQNSSNKSSQGEKNEKK